MVRATQLTRRSELSRTRHRVLFLHGLMRQSYPYSARTVAGLIANASGSPDIRVSSIQHLVLDDGAKCPSYVVDDPKNDLWTPIEVIEIGYEDLNRSVYQKVSVLRKLFSYVYLVAINLPGLWRLLTSRSFLTSRDAAAEVSWRQSVLALILAMISVLIILMMLLIVISLVYGAIGYFSTVFDSLAGLSIISIDPGDIDSGALAAGAVALIALVLTLKKLLVSKKRSDVLEDTAVSMYAILEYQRKNSNLNSSSVDRVNSVLRRVREDEASPISIIAFSQGSLLAIDALLSGRRGEDATSQDWPEVERLVTIGCPLALVSVFWPDYWKRWGRAQARVNQWINYYETHDSLGSKIGNLIDRAEVEVRDHKNEKLTISDRSFSYDADNRGQYSSPHFSYWREDAGGDQRPSVSLVAQEIVSSSKPRVH